MSRPVQQSAGMDVATSRLPDHTVSGIDHVKQLVRVVLGHRLFTLGRLKSQ